MLRVLPTEAHQKGPVHQDVDSTLRLSRQTMFFHTLRVFLQWYGFLSVPCPVCVKDILLPLDVCAVNAGHTCGLGEGDYRITSWVQYRLDGSLSPG
jgi:hypothetical protein